MNVEIGRVATVPIVRGNRVAVGQPQAKRALRLKLYLTMMAADVLALVIGFIVANAFRFGVPFAKQGITTCMVVIPVYLGIAMNSRAYMIDVLTVPRRGIMRGLMSLGFTVCAILFVAFCLHATLEFSRIVFGVGTIIGAGLMVGERFAIGRYGRHLCGGTPLSAVVIRDGYECPHVPDAFRIDAEAANLAPDISDPIMLDRLGQLLKNADRVVIACPPERRAAWSLVLKGANIGGELFADELDTIGAIGTGRFAGQPTLTVSCGPLALQERAIKRLLDLSVAITALIVLAPILVATAIAIKLDSRGPVLFVQERLGRGNRLFRMYKFRSMRVEKCDQAGVRSTRRDDDRITAVGRFIRSTSIDELPQILNVLRGDMSLVGPRPHALGSTAGDKLFWEVDSRYWIRHASKPGLTGLAQVRGYRGATHETSDLTNRLRADLEYLSGWTIWRDISILLATFRVLVHRNAF